MFLYIYTFGEPCEPYDEKLIFAASKEEADRMLAEGPVNTGDPLSLVREFPVELGVAREGRVVFVDGDDFDIAMSPFADSVSTPEGDIRY